jgi:hypothetical protein
MRTWFKGQPNKPKNHNYEYKCKNSSDRDSVYILSTKKNNALHIEPFIKSGILSLIAKRYFS